MPTFFWNGDLVKVSEIVVKILRLQQTGASVLPTVLLSAQTMVGEGQVRKDQSRPGAVIADDIASVAFVGKSPDIFAIFSTKGE